MTNTTIKTKRVAHRIYEFQIGGNTYQVDGQNHEFNSREWQLFVLDNGEFEWHATYPTKREAIEDIAGKQSSK